MKNKKTQENSGFKLIFQFPPKTMQDEKVKKEIGEIMASALQEQLSETA